MMEKEFNFDDMRSFTDEEMNEVILRVIENPEIKSILAFAYPDEDPDAQISKLKQIRKVQDFQHQFIASLILSIQKKNKSQIHFNGLETFNKGKKYLFISNHRDIIMDAGILNSMLDMNGWETSEIAIGDNLCAKPWISDCLRMNKCFLVKRSGTKRELFDAFLKLSAYIRRNITELRNSVWIAQREGRTKDSNDRTQESLLKMLSVSSVGSLKQGFVDLNISPICISYEYDSCDYLKAKEFQQKRDDENFQKSQSDDILNMKVGIFGNKGEIFYELTPPINDEIEELVDEEDNRPTVLNKIAAIIDHRIHKNYHIFPINYVALDLLNQTEENKNVHYTEKEKNDFEHYVEQQIDKIDLPNKDIPFLKEKIWLMYANPLINYMEANKQ
ncbi:MAG: 1-acyl-sn-glycerol-3-phosphate acyltransferase [Paludibacteraceae bacterium]|nr:1-acyl-sn-glycerol-3-phosphate acyltransferase [Paludibacteraceae bacterium]MBR5972549.1 1-acyl-sn-glycerol-3-phosphate acyltransferase [Paludibacteraceae bacterium]